MKKQKIVTKKAPAAIGPYSQAIVVGNFVFTAGQIHLKPNGELLTGTVEEKMHQVMKNLEAVLQASGVNFSNVVKTTVYVTDESMFRQINSIYLEYINEPYPVRETVVVKALPMGAEIEISMIATKNNFLVFRRARKSRA